MRSMMISERPSSHLRNRAVVAVVLAIGLLLPACGMFSSVDDGNPLQHPELEVASARYVLPLTNQKAAEWQEDARPQNIIMSLRTVQENKPLRASLIYRSESQPDSYLIVTVVTRQNHIEIESKKGEYTFPRPIGEPIELDDIEIDSVEALNIAVENGGSEFLSRNPGGSWSQLSLNLMYEELYASSGPLVWRAIFASESVGTRYIRIDPESGQVLSVEDNPPRTQ